MDAIALLNDDHRKVEKLFQEVAKAPVAMREELFDEVVAELTIHSELEEQLLYPAFRAGVTHDLALESLQEQQQVKHALARLSGGDKTTAEWMAGFKVFTKDVLHHVQEAEDELFPTIERQVLSPTELVDLGARMQDIRMQLMAKVGA